MIETSCYIIPQPGRRRIEGGFPHFLDHFSIVILWVDSIITGEGPVRPFTLLRVLYAERASVQERVLDNCNGVIKGSQRLEDGGVVPEGGDVLAKLTSILLLVKSYSQQADRERGQC